MDRRELLATGGVSLIALAGCLGTYEVARRTDIMPDGSDSDSKPTDDDSLSEIGSQSDGNNDGPVGDSDDEDDTDGPLEDDDQTESNQGEDEDGDDTENDDDELYEPDDGPLIDENNETENNETDENETDVENESDENENKTEGNESGEVPDDRPEDPAEHVTWVDVEYEEFETEYGDTEVVIFGELRNDTGYDLAYLRVSGWGLLDGEEVTENTVEIAGLPAGETLVVEIPLYVEPEAIDEYQYAVWGAEYVDEDDSGE